MAVHHTRGRGADARQVGAEWRHRLKARAARAGDGDADWTGDLRLRCDACGAQVRVLAEDLGGNKRCTCGAMVRVPRGLTVEVRHAGPARWTRWVFAGIGLLIAVVVVVVFQRARQDEGAGDGTGPGAALLVLPTMAEARAVAESFLAADTLEDKLAHVRLASAMRESVEYYYRELPGMAEDYAELRVSGTVATRKASFVRFVVNYAHGDQRLLAVVPTEAGPRVDWPAFSRFDHRIWQPFFEETGGAEASVRVFASRGNYYNFAFSDDRAWRALRLDSPDHDGDFYGYLERGTTSEQAILRALRRNRRQRMILRIRRAPGEAPEGAPQVEILALEGLGWTRANAVEPAPVWGGG